MLVVVIGGLLYMGLISSTTIQSTNAQGGITINGAGATFPFPLIDTWRVDYKAIKPEVNINYQSIGSGG
jgi:phosphate transport system substrate-binding protein